MPDALRVLMLATYFPKPGNQLMGNWALAQAQAIARNGVSLEVISLTAWVPRIAGVTPGARAYAECPLEHDWDGLRVHYPRWANYPGGPFRQWNLQWPQRTIGCGWLTARHRVEGILERFRPHVIYAHHTGVNGILATNLHDRHGLPFLVTDHDFGEIEACRRYPDRRRAFSRVVERSSRMIAVSRRMENELRAQFPEARTITLPNGSNPVPEVITSSPRPPELSGKTVLFSCGAFYERKAFPLLIEAFARVADRYPDAVLRIAGDGAERDRIEQAIAAHSLHRQVTLLGNQPHARVIEEMAWCDAFALIGWDEPFATVYLEALAAGKPLVCCSDGGITDVVRDGVHGWIIPPRDPAAAAVALDRLLSRPEERAQLGRQSLELFSASLTWDRHAQRMIGLFQEAVRG